MPALAAFVAVALATVSLVMVWEWFRTRAQRRNVVGRLRDFADEVDAGTANVLRAGADRNDLLAPIVGRIPQLRDIEILMAQAEMSWGVHNFLLATFGGTLAFGLSLLILSGSLVWGLIGAFIGGYLPYAYIKRRRNKRMNAFEEQLPESIDLIGRALRAGHPLSSGFKMAADDGAEPVATELRRIFEEQRFGLPLQDSLLGMADRIPLMDVRILVTAILIQREVGGNLAEILDNLANVIRQRFTIRRQLRVYTAQGRMTGYLLAVLPIAIGFLLYSINPGYMNIMLEDRTGKIILGFGFVMQLAGYMWIRKIVNIEI
jgi:tight adherence protein B